MQRIHLCICAAVIVSLYAPSATAITPTEAGFIDVTQPPYNAAGNGMTNDYNAIQNALNAARDNEATVFLPAGDYLVDGQLRVYANSGLVGSCESAERRSRIILKSNAAGYGSGATPKAVIYQDRTNGGANTWYILIEHLDIVVNAGNAGAIGADLDGAENCFIFDVNVDLSQGGYAGFTGGFASGGLNADLSVTGGSYGFIFNNSRPSPTLSGCRFEGQTAAALWETARGSHVFVGCEFEMRDGVPVHKDIHGWDNGGTAVYVDCRIAYQSANGSNPLFSIGGKGTHNTKGIILDNVHVRYADNIIAAHAGKNPGGWVRYGKLAYDNPANKIDAGVWVEGTRAVNDNVYLPEGSWEVSDTFAGPADLCTRHRLPLPFPSFETDNAVNLASFASEKVGDDWAPAVNEAIAQAEANGSNVVLVPKGMYILRRTVRLGAHTRLVGIHPLHSQLEGNSVSGNPYFDTESDRWRRWDEAPYMIETPDDPAATCLLSNIGVRPNEQVDRTWNWVHIGFGAIKWQCGRYSLMKAVDVERTGSWRSDRSQKAMFAAMDITHTAPVFTDGKLVFDSDAKQKYHIQPAIPSRIMVESVGGNKRIAAKSIDSLNAEWTGNSYRMANITIKAPGGATDWPITSLRIANAYLHAWYADQIYIKGYNNGSVVESKTIDWRGQRRERTQMEQVSLNWSSVDSVVILSPIPFAIDDVVGNGGTSDFSGVSSVAVVPTGNDEHGITHAPCLGYEAYPLPENQPKILFRGNGGGRIFCFVAHGIQFMGAPYMAALNTTEPLYVYHLHAQHCPHPMARFVFHDADNVSIFGAKQELQFSLCEAKDCDNFRWYGGGGLYNPAGAHNAVRTIDCTNYLIGAPDWQIYTTDGWTRHDYWNEMLSRDFYSGTTEAVVAYHDGQKVKPPGTCRPLLWQYGEPCDAWGSTQADMGRFDGRSAAVPFCPRVSAVWESSGNLRVKVLRNASSVSRVEVTLMDLQGRQVYRTVLGETRTGAVIDARCIGSQTLLCRIRAGESARTVRVYPSLWRGAR